MGALQLVAGLFRQQVAVLQRSVKRPRSAMLSSREPWCSVGRQ
jgi:hypothetical protein